MGLQETLFGKTEYKPLRISDALQRSAETTAGVSLDRYRKQKGGILDRYTSMAGRVMPKVEAATDAGAADLSAASEKMKGFDPVATYERLRTGNLGALTGLTDTLSGVGRRQEAQVAARLGMAGRPRSSARDILRSSTLAAAFSPVAGQIFSGLGSDTGILGRQLTSQSAELRNLARTRPDIYAQLFQYGLAPLAAEQMGLEGETGTLNALADAIRKNYAGMDVSQKMGVADYMTRGSETIADTVGNLADAYTSLYGLGGGAGGGAGGGIGGILGGSASNPNLSAASRWGAFHPATYGIGGAPAYDVNTLTPAQQFQLLMAQQEARRNVPAGSTWE